VSFFPKVNFGSIEKKKRKKEKIYIYIYLNFLFYKEYPTGSYVSFSAPEFTKSAEGWYGEWVEL